MAYETNWYNNYQPKFRKAVLLVIHRAQKRSQITAGGVWNLDMETFVAVSVCVEITLLLSDFFFKIAEIPCFFFVITSNK